MYKVILFDLDGTLTESGEGITKSTVFSIFVIPPKCL